MRIFLTLYDRWYDIRPRLAVFESQFLRVDINRKGELWKFWRDNVIMKKMTTSQLFDFDFSHFARLVGIGFDRMPRFTEKMYDKYIFNHRSLYIYRRAINGWDLCGLPVP